MLKVYRKGKTRLSMSTQYNKHQYSCQVIANLNLKFIYCIMFIP